MQFPQAKASDLPVLFGRDARLGHRIVLHALAQRGKDLVRTLPGGGDKKDVPEPSLINAILGRQLIERPPCSHAHPALLSLGCSG